MSDHLPDWLRSAPRAEPTPSPEPATTDDEGLVYVEAATASAALADVHRSVGPDARIVGADKVLRGGLWGFFQKEMVQLAVDPEPDADHNDQDAEDAQVEDDEAVSSDGLAGVLARLAADEDDAELQLGATLRRELGVFLDDERAPQEAPRMAEAIRPAVRANPVSVRAEAPAARPEVPQPVAAPPPVAAPAPPPVPSPSPFLSPSLPADAVDMGDHGGTWSGRNLLRLGLPRTLVEAVLAQQPDDDAAWTYALARVLAPLCRPLPAGDVALIGPRAERVARALGVVMARTSGRARPQGSFAAAVRDGASGRDWLLANRGRRWTHLVVGGSGWEGLLFEDPLAVSWVGDDALVDAIRAAHDLGLVLGFGVADRGEAQASRATPMDLAIAIRTILEAHQ